MHVIIDQDIPIAEDIRLVKRLYKVPKEKAYPKGIKFAYQYLIYRDSEWIDICRVDNYRHDKIKTGTHVHKLNAKEVQFSDMDFEEAEEYAISLSERLAKESLKKW